MKLSLCIITLLLSCNCFSQSVSDVFIPKKKAKFTYYQFDFSIPLKANPFRGEQDVYFEEQRDYWFVPDGLSGRVGYGVHFKKWVSVGLNTGIDWKGTEKLVVAPVFGNLKFSPRLTKDDETRLFLSFGY